MPSTPADVAHLLRRVGFGVTPADLARYTPLDRAALIEAVLDTSASPPVTAPAVVADPTLNDYRTWVGMTQWWLNRMATTPTPLVEKLALFWHGHLTSSLGKVSGPLLFDQNQLFRTAGLGSFRDLCQAAAVQPAMLLYLDNWKNRVGSPNENFARECLELFTLGVNRYSQDDVVAAARAWTGYGLNRARTAHVFDPAAHDSGLKTFMGVTRRWTGPEIIDHVLLGPMREPAAHFLATKLWSFLAYPDPEPAVVKAVADAYLADGLSIRTMVRTILHRPEFWSDRARYALVRSPVEYTVALMRATRLTAEQAHPEWYLRSMGQEPFYPPNVSGWRQNAAWISSTSTWGKASFASYVRWSAKNSSGVLDGTRDVSVTTAVQRAFDAFGIAVPSPRTRAALEDFVTAERRTTKWAEQANLIYSTLLTPDFQLA